MNDIKKLISDLEEMHKGSIETAQELRNISPQMSYTFFQISEVSGKAAEELKRLIPVKREIEGGNISYFFVCEECHGQVGGTDGFCRHCGHPLEDEK